MRTPTRTLQTSASSSAPSALASSLDDGDEKQEVEERQQPQPPPPPRLALPLAWRALEAALWPELVITWISAKKREDTA